VRRNISIRSTTVCQIWSTRLRNENGVIWDIAANKTDDRLCPSLIPRRRQEVNDCPQSELRQQCFRLPIAGEFSFECSISMDRKVWCQICRWNKRETYIVASSFDNPIFERQISSRIPTTNGSLINSSNTTASSHSDRQLASCVSGPSSTVVIEAPILSRTECAKRSDFVCLVFVVSSRSSTRLYDRKFKMRRHKIIEVNLRTNPSQAC